MSDLDIPNEITKLLHTSNDLSTPIFRFDISPEAAQHNWELIEDSDFNLTRLLNPKSPCITNFGSEFKSVSKLAGLFRNHPRWGSLKEILTNGVNFPIEDLDEDLLAQDLEAAFKRGNHGSASKMMNF